MSNVSLVQIQTMRGNAGTAASFALVEAAVADYNKTAKAKHSAVLVPVLPGNTKGMQFKLALVATVARMHDCTMVRLGVHGGEVAICGTSANIAKVQAAVVPLHNQYATMAANAYDAAKHGGRVGFTNAYLCGCPAGLQLANKITATLAYGIGVLFPFPAPGNGAHYMLGQNAAIAATKPRASRAPRAPKPDTTEVAPAIETTPTGEVA